MYEIRDVPGRGKGLVANRMIHRGTRILSETPIITASQDVKYEKQLQESIHGQLCVLDKSQRQEFMSLYNMYDFSTPTEQYLGIFRTNALPIESQSILGGVFPEASRINHSCNNNAQKHWNENIGRHTIHALRDINEGEEITIYYLSTDFSRSSRRKALLDKFKFACTCHLCCLPPEQSLRSDRRLREIRELDYLIGCRGLAGILSSPLRILRYADHQARLYQEQNPGDAGLARTFFDAAQIAMVHGDEARGSIFVGLALSEWEVAQGVDSAEFIKYSHLKQDPSAHELYGMSSDWRTTMDEIPRGLRPGDFEDWLWKRKPPQRPGHLPDLRNRASFPGFDDLPQENVTDLDFYTSSDMAVSQPRQHWCFLAEIVDFYTLARLQMDVCDIDGKEISLFFYTQARGHELTSRCLKKGNTVAILYAQQHQFLDGRIGIRHEDPSRLKIFPTSLRDLLAASDEIQEFSASKGALKVCHGCGKSDADLGRCGGCKVFGYCSKACQVAAWDTKNHKARCKLLTKHGLNTLIEANWDVFNGNMQF